MRLLRDTAICCCGVYVSLVNWKIPKAAVLSGGYNVYMLDDHQTKYDLLIVCYNIFQPWPCIDQQHHAISNADVHLIFYYMLGKKKIEEMPIIDDLKATFMSSLNNAMSGLSLF
ncbi:hypothetical protein BDA99DRAFT_535119 [Phascolomyces articulosus]|uniref:Uncharacterized protein n=1 Tax=Phascolomyces articulosus TaxID=60185 RepID=A0AAD5PGD6_9FUNG|nr:hypothetical protein BDA99DRAFT_535119 [Phascolomyces articulosus]